MKLSNKIFIAIWSVVFTIILGLVVAVNCVAIYWSTALTGYFGVIGEGGTGENFFTSDYDSNKQLQEAQSAKNLQIAQEGAVLMQNKNDALPLNVSTEKKVSVFSVSSVAFIVGGKGSGEVSSSSSGNGGVKDSLESAGFEVNPTLWSFYLKKAQNGYGRGSGTAAGAGNEVGNWKIGEVPQKDYTQEVKNSYSNYNSAAIVIISRSGGEGGDLTTDMSAHGGQAGEHYLQLNTEEKDMFKAINEANFKKIIVIINSANSIEMGFIEEYGVDSCIWLAGTGVNGVMALGEILAGQVNPSGRLVDTYVYDNFSSPAMQNFGWNLYLNGNGNKSGYAYVNYGEGIYVGYKYYETRYEDKIYGVNNVGDYNYTNTVYRSFGYGESYTTFTYSDFSVNYNAETKKFDVSVKVTNDGKQEGKAVVELYMQSPFTEYDKANGVEKSSVELVGFKKTSMLEKSGDLASETVKFSVDASCLASYDTNGEGTYIVDDGTYYFAIGNGAHDALNNILSAKGKTVADGMDYNGDANMVKTYVQSTFDRTTYKTSTTNKTIENQFATAKAEDATYLSRTNWTAMDGFDKNTKTGGLSYSTGTTTDKSSDNKTLTAGSRTISLKESSIFASKGWNASLRPASTINSNPVTVGAEHVYNLLDLRGVDYDDEKWDVLLDSLKVSEMHLLFQKAGYSTQAIESIVKPRTYDYDSPAGISNFLNGNGGYGFCAECVIASTWNVELAEEFGKLIGEDGLKTKTNGWYAPAMNIHRTPFSGRNYEYYSEDSVISGAMGAATVKGAQSKGMYCYIKHFALNDQESNRAAYDCVATWAEEQAIREIYLKPFQITVEEGDAHAVMTSMNRIGATYARGHYGLLTEVLRGEWGFKGIIITDYVDDSSENADQILSAGGDCILNTGGVPLSATNNARIRNELRRATHNILYTVVNSSAMNSSEGYSAGFPIYGIILIVLDVITAVGLGLGIYFVVKRVLRNKNVNKA